MKQFIALAAGSLCLAAPAFAQTAQLVNPSFEQPCLFCGNVQPEGWHSPGGNPLARRRAVGDGLSPAFFPVGTPNAITPRTGNAVLELGTDTTGGFVGVTTDSVNFCHCDQTCQTACASPFPFYDVAWDYFGGDLVVSGWYMIPASDPVVGDAAYIKLNIKVLNQDVATLENFNTAPDGGAITGHTNGEWRQLNVVFTREDIQAHYECNTGARPDCGCVCVPTSPLPNRVKITPSRFVADGTPTSGKVFFDDITVVQLPPDTGCGSADFDGDGDVGTDADIEAFFACLGGNCCPTCGSADFDGDGDTGTDADIEAFFRVLGGGNC